MNNVVIAPDSDIYILKTPFEIDSENQLTFSNATAQYNYFSSLSKLELENATYQRKDGILRWPGNYDNIIGYNYCMYRNTAYSNKWFYAYIEEIKYENNNMTSIKLKTDVYQTWQFEIVYKPMFIAREHVNTDTIGLHTIPEGLETGEYVVAKEAAIQGLGYDDLKVVFGVTRDYYDFSVVSGGLYGGVYSGFKYYSFDLTDSTSINDFIDDYQNNGFLEDIKCLFLAPRSMCNVGQYNAVINSTVPYSATGYFTLTNSLDGYVPTNKKLYTSPYNYLVLDNHAGAQAKLNIEDMGISNPLASNAITFKFIGSLGIGCSSFIYPFSYARTTGLQYGLPLAKLPSLSWTGDSYTNWLTQNAINIPLGVGTALIGGAALLGSGGAWGYEAVGTGISAVVSQLRSQYDHSFMPAQSNGQMGAVDCLASDSRLQPSVYQMCCKSEYLKIIDQYFNIYGYQVNTVKLPNILGRTNWNYVKTRNPIIVGNIPQEDIQELKRMFVSGITFWHNPSTFLDYSQSNTIIT